MIELKFILAVILAVLPHLFSKYFRNISTENKNGEQPLANKRTLMSLLSKHLPHLKTCCMLLQTFFSGCHETCTEATMQGNSLY